MKIAKGLSPFLLLCVFNACNDGGSVATPQSEKLTPYITPAPRPWKAAQQRTWVFADNKFIYNVLGDSVDFNEDNEYDYPCVKSITVVLKNTGERLQQIVTEDHSHELAMDSTQVFAVEDMNFDGYNDIRLIDWVSTNFQMAYAYWFYDPGKKLFVRDTILDDVINPFFHQKEKLIHTWWNSGANEFGHSLYKWKGKKLELVADEIEQWWLSDTGTLETTEFINGKLRTRTKMVKDRTIDYLHDTCFLKYK